MPDPTPQELIAGLQTRILEIEQYIDEIKKRPGTPDRATEIDALKKEMTELRAELAEAKVKKQSTPISGKRDEDDVSLGYFSGD